MVLTKSNQSLIIDPGIWSDDFKIPKNPVGVIITHEHADHLDVEKLKDIILANPNIYIYAHVDILAHISELSDNFRAVTQNESLQVGDFKLKFVGGDHAIIHPDHPVCANLGIVVDDGAFYYPGDSFVLPDCEIDTLAVPTDAPWLKISETMDFLVAVKPKYYLPVHNAVLSEEGREVFYAWLEKAARSVSAEFKD